LTISDGEDENNRLIIWASNSASTVRLAVAGPVAPDLLPCVLIASPSATTESDSNSLRIALIGLMGTAGFGSGADWANGKEKVARSRKANNGFICQFSLEP
jgi:hypothetical protein